MPNRLNVDVVIPNYNSARWLVGAVESVLNQTCPAASVSVVDDGSSDNSMSLLERYGERLTALRHPSNNGLPAARNTGIRAGSSPLVAFLDADDEWLPEKLALQVAEFERTPSIGLCYTGTQEVDPDLRPIGKPRLFRERTGESVFEELYLNAIPMPPSTVMVRREVFDRCGYFDEELLWCEDFEYWLRIAMRFPVSCIARVLCRRRVHPQSLSGSIDYKPALRYDEMCFMKCGQAAAEWGVSLPMPVEERVALSRRRRMKEFAMMGEPEAARECLNELRKSRRARVSDALILFLLFLYRRSVLFLKERVLKVQSAIGSKDR